MLSTVGESFTRLAPSGSVMPPPQTRVCCLFGLVQEGRPHAFNLPSIPHVLPPLAQMQDLTTKKSKPPCVAKDWGTLGGCSRSRCSRSEGNMRASARLA